MNAELTKEQIIAADQARKRTRALQQASYYERVTKQRRLLNKKPDHGDEHGRFLMSTDTDIRDRRRWLSWPAPPAL